MNGYFGKADYVGDYLKKRADIGSRHSNDRVTEEKKSADAKLRGQIGCKRANELIKSMDDLRARGF